MDIENFIIDKLNPTDANHLHQFIIDNNDRLKLFFPVT